MTAAELMTRYCDGDADAFRRLRETVEKLMSAVRQFSAGRAAEDDRTVVVIRRTGRPRGASADGPPAASPLAVVD